MTFRILGKQLCLPTENGTEFISTDSDLSKQQLDALLDRSLTLQQQHQADAAEQCPLSALVLEGTKIKQFDTPPAAEEFFAAGLCFCEKLKFRFDSNVITYSGICNLSNDCDFCIFKQIQFELYRNLSSLCALFCVFSPQSFSF